MKVTIEEINPAEEVEGSFKTYFFIETGTKAQLRKSKATFVNGLLKIERSRREMDLNSNDFAEEHPDIEIIGEKPVT